MTVSYGTSLASLLRFRFSLFMFMVLGFRFRIGSRKARLLWRGCLGIMKGVLSGGWEGGGDNKAERGYRGW